MQDRTGVSEHGAVALPASQANLPAEIPPPGLPVAAPPPRRRRWMLLLALALLAVFGASALWWLERPTILPSGIAASNGRLEADEIDIAAKLPGRVAEIRADEGDMVKAGQVLAVMDTRDLEAQLHQAQATVEQAQHTADAARADMAQQRSQIVLAAQELQRTRMLVPRGAATQETLDRRQSQMDAAFSAYNAAQARLAAAEAAAQAASHGAEVIGVTIADSTLVAPKDGRIQYRLANVGEVLGAGGKVFTMLDTGYVYMDVFLPTAEAGRVRPGAAARILLDALPNRPLPAQVAFVSPQNQFTPKAVETKSERDKLMFRVRVRLNPALLHAHAEQVRSGLPGLAYVRLDPAASWPKPVENPVR